MNQSKADKIRTNIENWTSSIFTVVGRLFIAILVLAVFTMVYKGLSNDDYLIQAFQVPGDFEDKGYNGVVLSRKVQDRVVGLKEHIASSKEDEYAFEAELEPDLEVGVMGFGLSLNTVTYHLKSLLGRKNKIITGELTDLNNRMELTIRMSGYDTENHSIAYEENADEALDFLLEEAAKTILKNTDPYRLAVYHYQKKEYHKALQLIVYLLEKKKDTEWAYLAWGNLCNKQGKREEAIEKWKKARAINPNFRNPLSGLAWAYISKREYGEATMYFEQMIEIDAKSYSGWNGLAQCYKYLEDEEKALAAYDKTIEVMPDKIWGYANKAEYLWQYLKDTAGATFLYQKGAEITPDGIEKYISLAGAYMAMGENDKMMEYVDKALEIDPNNSLGNMIKINILFYDKKYKEALDYLGAISAIPDDARGDRLYHKQTSLNSLAMASYFIGKYKQAETLAKKSISVNPNNPLPYTSLAETYSLMGKDEAFYEALEKAFKRGISAKVLIEDAPYQRFLNKKRFKELVKKYEKKTAPLDQVAKN